MLTIKDIVVKNMRKITLIMVVIIFPLSTIIQVFNTLQTNRRNAIQIFEQIEQILDKNSDELKQVRREYEARCLNEARMVAYILEYNPEAMNNVEELKKMAVNAEVDEIHIFDATGVIVAGTHPEYYGYSFDSGEQMGYFKPLLTDKSLELVQDITPNTAESKLVQYSALWSEDGSFIVQVGMYPANVLRATAKNELSYIFSLLRTGVGYRLYAVGPDKKNVVGSTDISDVDKDIAEIGFQAGQLESGKSFFAKTNHAWSYCLSRKIGENYIIWAMPISGLFQSIFFSELLLLSGLLLISVILVYAVLAVMNRTVIDQIKIINKDLRLIQDGNLWMSVAVGGSREFLELSDHINSMVASLLQSSERLEMSGKIRQQKEELEKQHEQLENALERAEAANRAKSEFLFNMSHDIRTPMNAILGFTNLALESSDPEIQRGYLENIDISSKQLLDLVNNILELSKIEDRKVMIEEELIDVDETFRKLCTIFDSDLKKKRLTHTVKLEFQHTHMYVDRTLYSKIFLNIMSNAIKYTPEGGVIAVSFKECRGDAPDTCVVETVIEDNGIGMSAEFLTHAFETFSRERTSTVSGIQGTGLGLAIVKDLVELMRGTITIDSSQGKGTKVSIRLPHRTGEALKTDKPDEKDTIDPSFFTGRCILLAEDIDINAMIATKLLTDKGCAVERARDGVECVDMLLKAEEGHYDLILMDIQMPNMDGYEAAQAIRAFENRKKASIPILALTANAFKEDQDKAVEVGMNGHIAKPLDAVKMFQMMAQALQEK